MAKSDPPKCPNGHPANSSGNCFDNTCPYRNRPTPRRRHTEVNA
jgi:hypothetical protein